MVLPLRIHVAHPAERHQRKEPQPFLRVDDRGDIRLLCQAGEVKGPAQIHDAAEVIACAVILDEVVASIRVALVAQP